MAWYPNQYGQTPMYGGQVNYGGYPMQQPQMGSTMQSGAVQIPGIIWVDGEIGAKAYQMPAGVNGPVALWDTNDQVIYWKSMNQMGMPNPLMKIRYRVEESSQALLPQGQSGNTSAGGMSGHGDDYATKEDMEHLQDQYRLLREDMKSMKDILMNKNGSAANAGNQNAGQNGQNNGGNRGGNR